MRRVYEKCGYRHEGVARQKFWRDGRWHDAELFHSQVRRPWGTSFRSSTVFPLN